MKKLIQRWKALLAEGRAEHEARQAWFQSLEPAQQTIFVERANRRFYQATSAMLITIILLLIAMAALVLFTS